MDKRSQLVTVSELNTIVKAVLENEPFLEGIHLKGEISSMKSYPSGHLYFTLKDGDRASVSSMMFASQRKNLKFLPADGMQVILTGKVTLYEARGQYQFIAYTMEADGEGGFLAAFEALKKKLLAKGYFDESRKKPIPLFPKRVGVITSPKGAAVRDIISIMKRRWPTAEIILYPSLVQGQEAVEGLIEGLRYFYKRKERPVDAVIIGRGGGSIEDLWAFNDEKLANALYQMNVPVISAVGHETDFTICDFVADKRAATPSAAAELLTPNQEDLKRKLLMLEDRLFGAFGSSFKKKEERFQKDCESKYLKEPMAPIRVKEEKWETISIRFREALKKQMQIKEQKIEVAASSMVALNPMAVLSRGYSAVFDTEGKVISSVSQMKEGSGIRLRLKDGEAQATVTQTEEKGEKNGKENRRTEF